MEVKAGQFALITGQFVLITQTMLISDEPANWCLRN